MSACEKPSACVAEIAGRTECWQNVSREFCSGFPYKENTTCAKEGYELQMGPETWIREEVGSCRWGEGECQDGVKKGECFFGPKEDGSFHPQSCAERP